MHLCEVSIWVSAYGVVTITCVWNSGPFLGWTCSWLGDYYRFVVYCASIMDLSGWLCKNPGIFHNWQQQAESTTGPPEEHLGMPYVGCGWVTQSDKGEQKGADFWSQQFHHGLCALLSTLWVMIELSTVSYVGWGDRAQWCAWCINVMTTVGSFTHIKTRCGDKHL